MEQRRFHKWGHLRVWVAWMAMLIALESAAAAVTYTWTGGGGANTNWSNTSNWGGTAPANNETDVGFVFPALNGPYASHNDRTGLQVTSLDITTQLGDGDYLFTGNAITVSGQATMASPASGDPNLVWQIPMALAGDFTVSASGRQTQLQGAINLGDHTLALDAAGDIVLAGTVGGSGNLIKNNGSALTITGTNSYTGATIGNRGALYIANAAAFGSTGTGTTFTGGFLGFVPGSAFTVSEPFVFDGGAILAYGTPTMAGLVTLNTTIDIQAFDALAALTIAGTITGPGGFNKTGPGLLVLSAPVDPYAGATAVNGGTLQLDAALTSTNPVTVRSGATLKGDGASRGTIAVQNGGTVAPGASPGGISSSGLSLAAGATFAAEIDGPIVLTQYDTIAVRGPVSLAGATLAVALGFTPSEGQLFRLIAQLQDDAVMGTFAGLAEGATFEVGGTTFGITYKGGAGNDVVLVAAPTQTPTSTPTEIVPTNPPTTTPTATVAIAPTPTATAVASACTGDCDGDGTVSLNELVLGVSIALDDRRRNLCPPLDADRDDQVTIAEVIAAVENALTSCLSIEQP